MSKAVSFLFSAVAVILVILLTAVITVNIYLDKIVLEYVLPPIEKYLDKKIEISGASAGLCGIKISDVGIKDSDNNKVFTCDKMYIYFSLGPLFNKEFIIDHVRFVGPRTTIYHKTDGEWVSIYTGGKEGREGKIKIELKKVFVERGEIRIIDEKAGHGMSIDFRRVNGYLNPGKKIDYVISGFVKDTKGKIKISGFVETGTNNYKVHFDGENLDAVRFNPYYRQYFNYPVETGTVTNISLVLSGGGSTYRNKGNISFKDLNFRYFEGQKPVHVIEGKIVFTSSPKIVLLEDISGVVDECPNFKVSGKIWPAVEGKDKYELLIDLKNPDYFLAKNRYIHQEGLDIKGRGNLNFRLFVDGDNSRYIGNADLRNVELDWGKVLCKPKDKMCAMNFDINCKADRNIWGNFKVVSKSLVIEGNGEIADFAKPEPKLDLNISLKEGRVGELMDFLPPWPEEIKFFGATDGVNVRIFNEGSSKTMYSVSINGTPLMWQYAELFNKPYGMESKIDFTLIPEKDKLLLVNSRLTFGESEVRGKIVEIDLNGRNGLSMELDLMKLVYDDVHKISGDLSWLENCKLSGRSSVKMNILNVGKFPNLKCEWNLNECEVHWGELLSKPKGVGCMINFDLLFGENNLIINKADVLLGGFEITGNGMVENYGAENEKLVLEWEVNNFDGSELVKFFQSGSWLKGIKIDGLSKGKISVLKKKDDIIHIDSCQLTIGRSVFEIKGDAGKHGDNINVFLDVSCDRLFLKEIIPYFSTKMAGELEGLGINGASKMNLRLENCAGIFTFNGDINLKDNYVSYKNIVAKPEGLDGKIVFKIVNQGDSVNFNALKFVWNNSSLDLCGKMDSVSSEPVLDLNLTGRIFYPELKMVLADTPEGKDILKKFWALKDKNERIDLNLKITGKIENPEIKSDWGLIAAVIIKIGLQNSIEFLENAAGKTLETTLNFGKKTVETTVLVSGKVLRETVRAGINVIEGVFKIVWPFKKK